MCFSGSLVWLTSGKEQYGVKCKWKLDTFTWNAFYKPNHNVLAVGVRVIFPWANIFKQKSPTIVYNYCALTLFTLSLYTDLF